MKSFKTEVLLPLLTLFKNWWKVRAEERRLATRQRDLADTKRTIASARETEAWLHDAIGESKIALEQARMLSRGGLQLIANTTPKVRTLTVSAPSDEWQKVQWGTVPDDLPHTAMVTAMDRQGKLTTGPASTIDWAGGVQKYRYYLPQRRTAVRVGDDYVMTP